MDQIYRLDRLGFRRRVTAFGNFVGWSKVTIPIRTPEEAADKGPKMSSDYGIGQVRIWIMGFGLAMILIGVALIASWTRNILLLPAGFFIMTLGIGAVATGMATSWWDRPPVPKVRCRQCYTLNYETSMRCKNCKADLF